MSAPGSAVEANPATSKRQYRNNTLGWLGVVLLDPKGEERGFSVEPQGTVWLSDAEAILTARAPRQAKDNPFEEQEFGEQQPDGKTLVKKMRPLVPISESRWVPQEDRYIPPVVGGADAHAAATAGANASGDTPGHATTAHDPVAAASETAVTTGTPRRNPIGEPPIPTAVPLVAQEHVGPQAIPQPPNTPPAGQPIPGSWTEPPGGEHVVVGGTLGGENAPVDDADPVQVAAAESAPAPPVDQSVAVQPSSGEEVAVAEAKPEGEETGAAQPPAGDPPEGEFAEHEEAGSPDAAAQGADA